jgi:hypothetical protein
VVVRPLAHARSYSELAAANVRVFENISPMSVFSWLKQKLTGATPQRDVSRLESSSESLDVLKEIIDTSGGPLKPHHRRRALRDKRLLPKPPAPPIRFGKRKRIISPRDAARWFSQRRSELRPVSSGIFRFIVRRSARRTT